MTAARARAPRLLALAALAALALTGCAAAAPDDAVAEDVAAQDAIEPAEGEELVADVPEECREAFPTAGQPADLADVDLLPADWPAPPAGATLCLTMDTVGGTSESASYAADLAIDDVFAHYESALSGYDMFRADGAENGTGYATLDGVGADVDFQIRESNGGFVLLFVRSGTEG